MPETVRVPGIKKPLPKWAVFAGLGAVAAAAFLYYRAHRQPATPAATSTDQYPPDGTVGDPSDPYSTDPATGQTYGNEAAGSGGTYGAFGPTPDASGIIGYDGNGNPIWAPGYGPGPGGNGTGGPPFPTNAAWAQYVVAQLGGGQAVLAAIGLYLNGQQLTAAQAQLVYEATALAGDPPVAGAGGYPPKLHRNGDKGGQQFPVNPVTGLKATARTTQADLSWHAAEHATGYRVTLRAGDKTAGGPQTVTGPAITLHNLAPGTRYTAQVLALPPATTHAKPASVTFTTRKSGAGTVPNPGGPSRTGSGGVPNPGGRRQ